MPKIVSLPCLSVRQPWASLIVHNFKPIENRTWPIAYRGPFLVHAGKTWGRDEQDAYRELLQIALDHNDMRRVEAIQRSQSFRGGIVGFATLSACISRDRWIDAGRRLYDGWKNWFCGDYGWILKNPVALGRVVVFPGRQGLFRIPCGTLKDLLSEDEHEALLGYFFS